MDFFTIVCIKEYFHPGMGRKDDERFLVGDKFEAYFDEIFYDDNLQASIYEMDYFSVDNVGYLPNDGQHFVTMDVYREKQINNILT